MNSITIKKKVFLSGDIDTTSDTSETFLTQPLWYISSTEYQKYPSTSELVDFETFNGKKYFISLFILKEISDLKPFDTQTGKSLYKGQILLR